MILKHSIIIFITQLVFIGTRTWNVKAIANNNITGALLSSAIVSLAWMVSISIGSSSMYKIITNMEYENIPIVICSLVGGLLGTFLALREKGVTK